MEAHIALMHTRPQPGARSLSTCADHTAPSAELPLQQTQICAPNPDALPPEARLLSLTPCTSLLQALLRRLSAKWTASEHSAAPPSASAADVPALLRHLRIASKNPATERYPTRVFMCAYMVLRHPEVVFSQLGDRERSLAASAAHLVAAFEALLHRVLEVQQSFRPDQASRPASAASAGLSSEASTGPEATFSLLLGAWDQAWGLYLEQFTAWKSTDAANLEVGDGTCGAAWVA